MHQNCFWLELTTLPRSLVGWGSRGTPSLHSGPLYRDAFGLYLGVLAGASPLTQTHPSIQIPGYANTRYQKILATPLAIY